MNLLPEYDVIVVGAGHAGSEAAAAAANMGVKVLLITMDLTRIAQMSCNPAMGGVAKGQIVREIDALGGYSGIVADISAVQFRMLNLSKGPAMWSPRTQNDRALFALEWRRMLEETPNIDFWQDMVTGISVEGEQVTGVKTALGAVIKAKSVILTSGTFLNGIIHIGEAQYSGGRMGDRASHGITEELVALGFESGRMKTGTPPRVDGRSLDYTKMEEQKGDAEPWKFSYGNTNPLSKQLSCWITYTNPTVHDLLREGFENSPMFTGRIQGIGPRYCPSIEDKIERFSDKGRHQLFVEPEGWNTHEIYVNGFSTSLPINVQFESISRVPGFENVRILRPGYAIEYDYFPPTQLRNTLETKRIENLYFAGQINGTTGYEEAAGQGMIAGMNAALKIKERNPFVLSRDEAYIGVLIDDLVTKGTEEPYRMFTSRAEHRILLRQDNADIRLTEKSYNVGLADENRMRTVEQKLKESDELIKDLKAHSIHPEEINPILEARGTTPIKQRQRLVQVLARPQITIRDLEPVSNEIKSKIRGSAKDKEVLEQAEISIKYDGYIARERALAYRMKNLDHIPLPLAFDYHKLKSLSYEAREKLSKVKPINLGQASRVSGVSPSDVSVLLVHLGR